jgi:uncharacterized protein (TIGR00369 family)
MNERTHSWETPKDVAETLLNLDKEDRRLCLREYPPSSTGIGSLMGFTKIEIDDDGHTSFYCKAEEFHYNPIGSVHGGLAATLLDSCNSISAQCNLDKGFIALTTDIKVNYLSQITVVKAINPLSKLHCAEILLQESKSVAARPPCTLPIGL